jgi:hypothetical protein
MGIYGYSPVDHDNAHNESAIASAIFHLTQYISDKRTMLGMAI